METLIIKIPEQKSSLVKQLLEELGATFKSGDDTESANILNDITSKTIDDARNGIGIGTNIQNVKPYLASL